MNHEERLQKLYVEFQTLSGSIKQIEQQKEALEGQLMELMVTDQSLDEIKEIEKDTEILVPLSTGIYAKAQLKENGNFLVNAGSNVMLNKDMASTKKIIEGHIDEVKKLQDKLTLELRERTKEASLLEEEMKKIASALENK